MKVAPLSADLLLKLGIALGLGVGVWVLVQQSKRALGELGDSIGEVLTPAWNGVKDAAWSVAPTNQNNVFYQTANTAVSAAVGREETVGGAWAEVWDPATREVNRLYGAPTPDLGVVGDHAYDAMGNQIY